MFYLYFLYFLIKSFFNKITFNINVNFYLYLVLVVSYCTGVLVSDSLYITNKSELFNILWWSLFTVLFATEFKSENDTRIFIHYFSSFCFFGSVISGTLGIFKLILIEKFGIIIESIVFSGDDIILGTSLYGDYNVYALAIFFGILCGKYLKDNYKNKVYTYTSNITFPVLFTSMILSGSRRALILGFILIFLFFFFDFSNRRNISINIKEKFFNFFLIAILCTFFLIVSYTALESFVQEAEFTNGINRLLTIREEFLSKNDRTIRWVYAIDLLNNNSLTNSLFGNGFDYLSLFGMKYNNGYDDHPHNFFLSTLLYGGFFGLLILTLVLIKSVEFYFYSKDFSLFFLLLLVLIFFSLTSSNTLFSFRVIPVLLLLPALCKSNYKSAN